MDCAAAALADPSHGVGPTGVRRPADAPAPRRSGPWAAVAAAPVTWSLMALIGVVYALQWLTRASVEGVTESLFYAGLYTSPVAFEPWRMLTYALVHDDAGPTHVALNLLALWMIGRVLEPVLGWWRLLALLALSAVGGAVFALWTTNPLQPVVGASGAVYGLFAALFLVTRLRGGQVGSIAVLIGLNLAFSFLVPGISWQVHVGGLLTGAVAGLVLTRVGTGAAGRRSAAGTGAQAAGLVLILAVLAGLTVLGANRLDFGALVG